MLLSKLFFQGEVWEEFQIKNDGQKISDPPKSWTFFPSLEIWPTNMNVLSQFWQMSTLDDDKGASQSPPKMEHNNTFAAKSGSMTKSRY